MSIVSKVKSAYGNATKQLQALGASLAGKKTPTPASTPAPTPKFNPTATQNQMPTLGGGGLNTSSTTPSSVKQPVGPMVFEASPQGAAYIQNRPPSVVSTPFERGIGRVATVAGDLGKAVSGGAKAVAGGVSGGLAALNRSLSGGGGSPGMAGVAGDPVFNATDIATGKPTNTGSYRGAPVFNATDIATGKPTNTGSYRGAPTTESTTYNPGQTPSLEAQNSGPNTVATAEDRERNKATITDGAASRKTQTDALNAELTQLQAEKAARDAAAPTVVTQEGITPEEDELQKALEAERRRADKRERDVQKQIEDLSKPSPEELAAQAQEDELNAREAAINAGVTRSSAEISDQPIPYGFITGQRSAVERRANADLETIAAQKMPITQKLAREQSRRAAALDVVKSSATRLASRSDKASDRVYDYLGQKKKDKRSDAQTTYDRGQDTLNRAEDTRQFNATNARLSETSNSPLSRTNLEAGEAKLRASRGPDGYVNPNVYQQAFNEWPGTTAEFLSKYPPKNYVNPSNTWLPKILMPAGAGREI